jgi:hypothetical protein
LLYNLHMGELVLYNLHMVKVLIVKAVRLVLSRYINFHVVKWCSAICSDYFVVVREY